MTSNGIRYKQVTNTQSDVPLCRFDDGCDSVSVGFVFEGLCLFFVAFGFFAGIRLIFFFCSYLFTNNLLSDTIMKHGRQEYGISAVNSQKNYKGKITLQRSPKIWGLIPARLASTRLPDKPLIDIAGWPMLRHVYTRACQADGVASVAIATPDVPIADTARLFGAQVVMTSHTHLSGTDRLAEAARLLDLAPEDIVINIQGDEPLLDPSSIEVVIAPLLENTDLTMSSLMCPCPPDDLDNPACVKVVCALNGNALYFSRTRLPYVRNADPHNSVSARNVHVRQHIGLYAYRNSFLQRFASLSPGLLEQAESLEQLRALEHGYSIRMVFVEKAPVGVDTLEDLNRVRDLFSVEKSREKKVI